MKDYPFSSMLVNGRSIDFGTIVSGLEEPRSEFEASLFEFTTQWLRYDSYFPLTTSGSTGTPKQISVSRDHMIGSAKLTEEALGLRRGQKALLCLSPEFIAGKMMMVRSFVTGLSIIAVSPESNPLAHVTDDAIDFCAMVPVQVHELTRSRPARLDRIKTLIIGGGVIDEETLSHLQKTSCACYATYGMTETISHVALRRLNGERREPFFTALPGIRFQKDNRGCLVVYWTLIGEPILTNDVVQLLDDHRFNWLGRWDNVINTGGIKVIPEKLERLIEQIFTRLDLQDKFIVSHVNDTRLGSKVILIIEGQLEAETIEKIRALMKEKLDRYEMPREILCFPMFVYTSTGKVNRNETRIHALSNRSSSV